tara:strand:- start:2566 stop:2802 length:237 start_codon:yes stop_codon:yes gene_type:complete
MVITVAVDLSRGPIVYLLQKYPFITVFTIHALLLARYRQAFAHSGAKDDPTDFSHQITFIRKNCRDRQIAIYFCKMQK